VRGLAVHDHLEPRARDVVNHSGVGRSHSTWNTHRVQPVPASGGGDAWTLSDERQIEPDPPRLAASRPR
jgi:hypothetical protein